MFNYIKSDWLKQKRKFNKKLIWIAPLLTILLALLMMGDNNLQNGAYNWWYIMILPACFTMFSSFTIINEKKKNRHGLLGVVIQKNKLWLSQIIVGTIFLFITCIIFFIGITIGGILFKQKIELIRSLFGSVVLFFSFAWQIPFWMFITEKLGGFISIFLSLICNFGVAIICAVESFWWIPFSIPSRLMCPIIGILPNGLWVETCSKMGNTNVIIQGLLITTLLYLLLTITTSLWFEKCEV